MKVKNLNRSSEKTRRAIKKAFAELLKEKKELNKITVNELAERADINRGTFYIHYDSIYGVAEDFESELLQSLSLDDKKLKNVEDINLYFDKVINYLKENENIYKMLLVSREPLLFLGRITYLLNQKIYDALIDSRIVKPSTPLKFEISFFADGIIIQVLKYFTTNYNYTLDDICNYMKTNFKLLFLENILDK